MDTKNKLMIDIESQIRNKEFKSKDELTLYLKNAINNGRINQTEIIKYLDLYDSIYINDQPLNMENYKGSTLDEQNFIISTETDQILKTNESAKEINKEFKELQNEMIADNKGDITTADDVFEKMVETKKEELNLIPLIEIFEMQNIEIEKLQKIKYFLNNQYINPYDYKIDLNSNIFYNVVTKEMFEVRKNEQTNEYEIYKGSEIVYKENEVEEEQEQEIEYKSAEEYEQELEYQNEEEKQLYESRKNVKKRVLVPPRRNPNNYAFSKMSFIIINIITFITLITMMIFLNK